MPRIYKPVKPAQNKAAAGPTETNTPAPASAPATAGADKTDKKGNGSEK